MKILVTGGTGMVGTALKRILPNAVYVSSLDADLRDANNVKALLYRVCPDIIVHLAATVSGVEDNIKRPYSHFIDNVLMNSILLERARAIGVKRFIGVLSTCIYPDVASKYPMTEDQLHESQPTKTNFSYGYAKRMMAVAIEASNKQYGTKYQYVIPCNIYGSGDKYDDNRSHYIAALIKKIHEAKKSCRDHISLFGTGSPIRQFMYSHDFALALKHFIENDITENVNVCPNFSYTINEIANIALVACDAQHLKIKYDHDKPDGQYRKDASNEKFKQIMPEFNFTPLLQGIRKTYSEYHDKH